MAGKRSVYKVARQGDEACRVHEACRVQRVGVEAVGRRLQCDDCQNVTAVSLSRS